MNIKSWECPICQSDHLILWEMSVKPQGRYFYCKNCEVTFRSPDEAYLSPEEEKSRYELHENIESDGYRNFLDPLRKRMQHFLQKTESPHVLDFGCGPTDYLANLMRTEDHYQVATYDPYFCPNQVLHKSFYDGITSTEVFEHFYRPKESFAEIIQCLKPGGYLFVLTSPPPKTLEQFEKWHYRRDPTHIIFYSERTMQHLAAQFGAKLLENNKNLWVFQKHADV